MILIVISKSEEKTLNYPHTHQFVLFDYFWEQNELINLKKYLILTHC